MRNQILGALERSWGRLLTEIRLEQKWRTEALYRNENLPADPLLDRDGGDAGA